MICIEIDELTPCLKLNKTGESVRTTIKQITDKRALKGFTEKSGWYVNWQTLIDENEVYALYAENEPDIQGLVAFRDDPDKNSVYVAWMVAAEWTNPEKTANKKYLGVGGHLFAVAARKSVIYGHNGDMYGFAKDRETEEKFIGRFAVHIGALHPYHLEITEEKAAEIMEVYDYELEE